MAVGGFWGSGFVNLVYWCPLTLLALDLGKKVLLDLVKDEITSTLKLIGKIGNNIVSKSLFVASYAW